MHDETGAATAFAGFSILARGPLAEVAQAIAMRGAAAVLVFDDATGRVIDLDLRGGPQEVAARLEAPADERPRGRGRPRLGVVAREVTLLPRHWAWLGAQPGGASAALRRLVDEARRTDGGRTERRAAQDAAYRFMAAMAGDLPGFEDAVRALYAGDAARFDECIAGWPEDVRGYARQLGGLAPSAGGAEGA